jgi:hypothetical protein
MNTPSAAPHKFDRGSIVFNILVEARVDPNSRSILDELATTCSRLGHDVHRWRGPLSGRVPHSRRLGRCDLAIIFNGAHHAYEKPIRKLRRWGTKLLFVELGWFPQLGTFQLDEQGINAAASWVNQPLVAAGLTKLPARPAGDLLVLLQDDFDTQITDHSPWFVDMYEFVEHLSQYSELPLCVRAHPRHPPSDRLVQLIARRGCRMDAGPNLSPALQECRAVACVNSSAAVEALTQRVPVLCYGRAIYRHEGAVYCLDNDGESTRRTTTSLAAGGSELYIESIGEVLERITAHQWRIEQIPNRLPAIVESFISLAPDCPTNRIWRWPFRFRRAS